METDMKPSWTEGLTAECVLGLQGILTEYRYVSTIVSVSQHLAR